MQRIVLLASSSLAALLLLSAPAAALVLRCEFRVAEDRVRNVRPVVFYDDELVFHHEASRIAAAGPHSAIVRADAGSHCVIRHAENLFFGVGVDKNRIKLDPYGRMPNCSEFTIATYCYPVP